MSLNKTIEHVAASAQDPIQAIKDLVESTVEVDMKWYRQSSIAAGRAHYAFGTLVIAFSASLPLISSQSFPRKDLVISVIGILIAFLSGLNSFYRPGELWKTNMKGMVELKNELAKWQLRMVEAEHAPQEGTAIAVEATNELFAILKTIDIRNADDYVNTISVPGKQP